VALAYTVNGPTSEQFSGAAWVLQQYISLTRCNLRRIRLTTHVIEAIEFPQQPWLYLVAGAVLCLGRGQLPPNLIFTPKYFRYSNYESACRCKRSVPWSSKDV